MQNEQIAADSRLTPIRTESEAQDVASLWALENQVPSAWYIEFSHEWFRKTSVENRVFTHLHSNLWGFRHAREESKATWATYLAETQRLQCEWAIETVKHLAIINGAGIAGAVALLSGSENPLPLKAAILLFGGGLFLAVFNLWLNNLGYASRARDASKRCVALQAVSKWESFEAAVTTSEGYDPGKRWFRVAESVGWASAGVAIIGLILIGSTFTIAFL